MDTFADDAICRWAPHLVAVRDVEGIGTCAVIRTTEGRALLLVGAQLTTERIEHRCRFLYPSSVEAFEAMQRWIDPADDPPGPWVWHLDKGPPTIIRTREPRSAYSIRTGD